MNMQNTLDLIPTDLLHEIFSRLPAKSVGRCRCVSKKMQSILGSEDFKQLFLSRSLTRPRLLFASQEYFGQVFYSSPQPQNPYEKSSLIVTAEIPELRAYAFTYASGLLYFPDLLIPTTKDKEDRLHVICNPSTGQYMIIPNPRTDNHHSSFIGFDPIDKQFKVLAMNSGLDDERIDFILTLGTRRKRWRKIKCPFLPDYPYIISNGICINGVLYYIAEHARRNSDVIVCFDVRTETFKFKFIGIAPVGYIQLMNYKGKLGMACFRGYDIVELYMLVLEEDVEKHEWSKYTLPTINYTGGLSVIGMTSADEIVLCSQSKPLYLHYFNMEKESIQSVEVQGLDNHEYVEVIMDHVEDLYVNDAKYLKSNIHANLGMSKRMPRRRRKGRNKLRGRQ